jgi:hypothetical protein
MKRDFERDATLKTVITPGIIRPRWALAHLDIWLRGGSTELNSPQQPLGNVPRSSAISKSAPTKRHKQHSNLTACPCLGSCPSIRKGRAARCKA